MAKILALLLGALVLFQSQAQAQAPLVISGGAICDTAEEVKTFITTNHVPEGCGELTGSLAVMASVVEIFEHDRYLFVIGRYAFLQEGKVHVQYGIMGPPKQKPLDV